MTRPSFPPYIVSGVGEDGVEHEIRTPATWDELIDYVDDDISPVMRGVFRKIIIEINVEAIDPDDRLIRYHGG